MISKTEVLVKFKVLCALKNQGSLYVLNLWGLHVRYRIPPYVLEAFPNIYVVVHPVSMDHLHSQFVVDFPLLFCSVAAPSVTTLGCSSIFLWSSWLNPILDNIARAKPKHLLLIVFVTLLMCLCNVITWQWSLASILSHTCLSLHILTLLLECFGLWFFCPPLFVSAIVSNYSLHHLSISSCTCFVLWFHQNALTQWL